MYTIQTRVGYSQLSPEGRLSLTALLDLFQDCATLHGEDNGLGLSVLEGRGLAWLLSRWRLRLNAPLPVIGQRIAVETRAVSCRLSLLTRRFALKDESGQALAEAEALWVLTDKTLQKPVSALAACQPYLEPADVPPLSGLPRKVQPAAASVGEAPFLITADLLDTNRHCNNVRSAGLCARYVPEGFSYSAFAADYHLPLLPRMEIEPSLSIEPDKVTVALHADGALCMIAVFLR